MTTFDEYLDRIVFALIIRSIKDLQKINNDADYSYVDDNITFNQLVIIHGLIGYGIQYCKELLKDERLFVCWYLYATMEEVH